MNSITGADNRFHFSKPLLSFLKESGVFLLFLLIWAMAAAYINKSFILPRPVDVLGNLFLLIRPGTEFMPVWGATVIRGLAAFAASLCVGTGAAFLSFNFVWIKLLLKPMMVLGRSVPVVAFILLMVLWLPTDLVSVFVSFIVVTPLIYQNVISGLNDRDERLMEMADVFRFSPRNRFFHLTFPSLLPYLRSAMVSGLGISWKSVIAAEILSLPRFGIGTAMLEAQTLLETSVLFAWTIVIIIISSIGEWILGSLIKQRGGRHA